MTSPRPFPIPLVAGPGSQPEPEAFDYLEMPRDMATYRPPVLPEPEELAGHDDALAVLREVQARLRRCLAGEAVEPIDLSALAPADRVIVDQLLGEGEVAAQVGGDEGLQAQESVFAGVWRVLPRRGGALLRDQIEIGPVPSGVLEAAATDGEPAQGIEAAPPELMNAPSIYAELVDQQARWSPGQPPHVINLTLLPLTPEDSLWLQARLGEGRVRILSRGYGNCRVVSTRLPHTWRVTYFNAQDIIILDTLEVGAVPEVARAAREDLEDTAERLDEVLNWMAAA